MPPETRSLRRVHLPVPLVRQGNNCGCGLAAICMAMNFQGVPVTIHDLERHPLVLPRMLHKDGVGPGRLGRIALSYGCPVQIVDPDGRDVGKRFVAEGGEWTRQAPSKRHLLDAIVEGNPVVACIPDKTLAFEGCTHHGSHWVTVRAIEGDDFLIHDPAPWRKAERCKLGYWDIWGCSMIVIRAPRGSLAASTAVS